jgi:hypothetical protein
LNTPDCTKEKEAYSLLEQGNLLIRQGISLGNDGDQVHFGVQTTHHLDVQGLQRVARGLDEVDTSMHAVVDNVHPVDLVLRLEISIEALLNVLDNWAPGVIVVDEVTETRSVHHGQAETDAVFFDVGTNGLDCDSLGNNVMARALAFLRRVEGGVEQGVDESRLSQSGLTWRGKSRSTRQDSHSMLSTNLVLTNNHDVEVETLADTLAVPLVGQIGETHVAGQLPTDDIAHVGSSLSNRFRVLGAHRLGVACTTHRVASFDKRRGGLARGAGRLLGGCRGGAVGSGSGSCFDVSILIHVALIGIQQRRRWQKGCRCARR